MILGRRVWPFTLRYVHCEFLIGSLYHNEEIPPYSYFVKCVYHEIVLDFVKRCFCSNWDGHKLSLLYVVYMVYYIG